MPAKKKPTAPSALVRRAVRQANERARAVLRERRRALAERSAAVRRVERSRRARAIAPPIAPRLRRAAGPPGNAGVLVAEGDSWFDYPRWDVLKMLEDRHGFDVESVAHKGDRVEQMAYGPGQLDALCRLLEKLVRRNETPRAILLSGGGNDVAGDELRVMLDHAGSPVPGLNEDVLRGIVDHRIRLSYVTILTEVTRVGEAVLGRKLPILVHGYDYPVPDGRGFLGGWGPLPGPWLRPGFHDKGFGDLPENKKTMRQLIDRFNVMLQGIARLQGFEHVKFVNLRGTLSTGANHDDDWGNELHPTKRGFERVAAKFAAAL